MFDYILLIARLLLVVILYIFLFIIMKTGIGIVKGQRKKVKSWTLIIEKGPKELGGVSIKVTGTIIVGRSPDSDIVIATGYVSGRHARFSLMGHNLFIEDLGSTNGTAVNGQLISQLTALKNGDMVSIGDVEILAHFKI
ncbi:MAG: FHA domain-containing protein [Eggerthellaceae bacterium]|nr:FHA domain-containing protein [Eggerthellaceae bacterium]